MTAKPGRTQAASPDGNAKPVLPVCATRALRRAEIRELFVRLSEAQPQPRTDLHYASPFELLVAVMLSAQATDASVNKATRVLFARANTPASMLGLGETRLKRHIASIGLFNSKAANVMATCSRLLELHDGTVPHDRAALEALPGVGRKTANVVMNVAFGEPVIAVDTHVFRVANRTGLAMGSDVRAVEDALMRRVPEDFLLHAHHWLILHGRYTCIARRPRCPLCPIRDLCRYPCKTPGVATPALSQ